MELKDLIGKKILNIERNNGIIITFEDGIALRASVCGDYSSGSFCYITIQKNGKLLYGD